MACLIKHTTWLLNFIFKNFAGILIISKSLIILQFNLSYKNFGYIQFILCFYIPSIWQSHINILFTLFVISFIIFKNNIIYILVEKEYLSIYFWDRNYIILIIAVQMMSKSAKLERFNFVLLYNSQENLKQFLNIQIDKFGIILQISSIRMI
ncbi:hypothetical protein pb186bvf_006942 [Paramecium bursaria]